MTQRQRSKNWSEFFVAMDRIERVYANFISNVLVKHASENVSMQNILFLLSMGEGESKVSEIVRKGRYVGSNATYALKALEGAGLIDRRQDAKDRRNWIIFRTEKGEALVNDIRAASVDTTGYCRESWEALNALENHCARAATA